MIYLTGELVPTASQARRQYAYLNVGNDGRTGTAFLNVWHAQRRHNTAVYSSSYSVGEVELVGWAGRAFILDKLTGNEEHGEAKPGDRKPPYRVLVGRDGEIKCNCTAQSCQVGLCRHTDLIVELIEQGAFESDTPSQGEYHGNHVPTTIDNERQRPTGVIEAARSASKRSRGEAGRLTPDCDPMVQGGSPHRRSNSPFNSQANRQVTNNFDNSEATAIDSEVTLCHNE